LRFSNKITRNKILSVRIIEGSQSIECEDVLSEDYEKDFVNSNCRLCSQSVSNRRSLGNHLVRSHKGWNLERYVTELCLQNEIPVCACGCGQRTSWHKTKYRYNEYVTGHNNTFSKEKQPKFTNEQIQQRNEKIRQAYRTKKQEISNKISESLKVTFDCDEQRARMSNHANKLWSNSEFRLRVSEGQRKSWRNNYAERYAKVFTPEMRLKLSLANQNSKNQFSSKLEKFCIDSIKTAFGSNVQESFWINSKEGSKCYDVFFTKEKMLLELDGIYWHGLDRATNYTAEQLSNMANDRCKERVARENGYSLLRLALDEGTPKLISEMQNLQELFDACYHYQTPHEIIRDGRFEFQHDDQALVSKESLIAWSSETKGREYVTKRVKPAVIRFFQEYFESKNWLYPSCGDSIEIVLAKLANGQRNSNSEKDFNGSCKDGSSYLKASFRSYWHADNGPAVVCKDYKVLDSVVSYRMGINKSKLYEYEMPDGSKKLAQETFDLTPRNIRNGFVVQRKAVSWFPPALARDVWRWVLRDCDIRAPKVWDPSGGFGARMLGFAAAFHEGHYIASEPASMTFEDLQKLANDLNSSSFFQGNIEIFRKGSESMEITPNSLDAVFTSPPYFDREKYFEESEQCWLRYPDFASWNNFYLLPTFRIAFSALKPGKRMVINVSKDLQFAILEAARAVGFLEEEHGTFSLKRDAYARKKGKTYDLTEPMLSFLKPSAI